MIKAMQQLGAVDLPSSVSNNATLLEAEVQRLDGDIQNCRNVLPADWVAAWEIWRDTALALVKSVQNPAWYDIAAGGLWIAVNRAFNGDGIRDMMQSLIKWRDQAKAKGCTVNGPGPAVPPMPLSEKIMWGAGGLVVLGLVGLVGYGIVTKQSPVQVINHIVTRRRK